MTRSAMHRAGPRPGSSSCAYGPRIFEQANSVINLPSRLPKSDRRSCRTRSARAGTASELAQSEAESRPQRGVAPVLPVEEAERRRGHVGPVQIRMGRHPALDGRIEVAGEGTLDGLGDEGLGDGDGVRCGDTLRVLCRQSVQRGVQRGPPLVRQPPGPRSTRRRRRELPAEARFRRPATSPVRPGPARPRIRATRAGGCLPDVRRTPYRSIPGRGSCRAGVARSVPRCHGLSEPPRNDACAPPCPAASAHAETARRGQEPRRPDALVDQQPGREDRERHACDRSSGPDQGRPTPDGSQLPVPGGQFLTVRYSHPPHVLTLVVSFALATYSVRTRNFWLTAFVRLRLVAPTLPVAREKQLEVVSVCQALL